MNLRVFYLTRRGISDGYIKIDGDRFCVYFRTSLVPQRKRETLNVGKMMEEFHNGALSFTIIPLSRCLTGGSNNILGLSTRNVYYLIDKGLLKASHISTRITLIKPKSVIRISLCRTT